MISIADFSTNIRNLMPAVEVKHGFDHKLLYLLKIYDSSQLPTRDSYKRRKVEISNAE